MDKKQISNYENLINNFEMLWDKFTILFPIANEIIKSKELDKLKNSFAEKYKNLCDSDVDVITSSCLFERFICTFSSSQQAKEFKSEVESIASATEKALKISSASPIEKKIKDIVKNMILTIDTDFVSKNNDYRNRLNEILIYNWLSECNIINVSFIEKDLGNGKTCDFECHYIDGSELLLEVLSINNLQVEKQDDSITFSDFINQKIKRKFEDKTKNLSPLPKLKIIPVLEYTEGLEDFKITIDHKLATSPLTVVKNTIDGIENILLANLEDISTCIIRQKENKMKPSNVFPK